MIEKERKLNFARIVSNLSLYLLSNVWNYLRVDLMYWRSRCRWHNLQKKVFAISFSFYSLFPCGKITLWFQFLVFFRFWEFSIALFALFSWERERDNARYIYYFSIVQFYKAIKEMFMKHHRYINIFVYNNLFK